MKPAMWLLILVGMLTLMWAAAAVRVTEPRGAGSHVPVAISPEKLSAVNEGMTIEEVTETIGCEGNASMDKSPVTGTEVTTIQWNSNGAVLRCVFKDNRLVQKYARSD